MMTPNMQKILCIQHRQMGDVLMCTPAVRLLREFFPHAQIDFLTEKLGEQVLQRNPHINRLIVMPRKPTIAQNAQLLMQIRRERYDVVIDFYGNPRSAQLTLLSGAGIKSGFDFRGRKLAYNVTFAITDDNAYAGHTKTRLLQSFMPVAEKIPPIEMPTDSEGVAWAQSFWQDLGISSQDKVMAFCPVSRRDYKMWSPQNWALIADRLIKDKGCKIWMVYGPGEKELAEAVTMHMQEKAILEYPMPTISQLRAVLEHCFAYVGNDGGNKHLAICAGLPTFTYFRQLNPANWTPPHDPKHQWYAEGNPGQPALDSLGAEEMYHLIEAFLQQL
jgi:ADP-heptose:LPS heptosyltransferase